MSKVDSGEVFLKFNNSFFFISNHYQWPMKVLKRREKAGIYSQSSKGDWLELEDFKGWLKRDEANRNSSCCTCCRITLKNASKSMLVAHKNPIFFYYLQCLVFLALSWFFETDNLVFFKNPLWHHWSPDNCFSRGTTQLVSWSDGERYSSLLLSLVSTLLFSRTGGVLFHL